MDGYSSSFRDFPAETFVNRSECIGEETELAWDMFRRLLKGKPGCGDSSTHFDASTRVEQSISDV